MNINNKLLIISHFGMMSWIYGEILKSPHSDNLVFTITVVIAVSIYQGIHQDVANKLKAYFKRVTA